MKFRGILLLMLMVAAIGAGCSGGGGVAPDREGATVGVVGDARDFPALSDIAGYLEVQYGPVAFINPGDFPPRMKYIFVTGYLGGPNIERIRERYFGPGEFKDRPFWPEPLVMRDEGRRMPGIKMIMVIARNRNELRNIFEYIHRELKRGKPFDFDGGTWDIRDRVIDPNDVPPRDREGEWNWIAHQRMTEVSATEMGYNSKVRKDAGAAYAIDYYYNGEKKYTSYIAGNETPMELMIRGSWECDIIHEAIFTGVFDNLLYRKLGHAWFPPDGWVGTADDWAYTYAYSAAVNFIWNTEGRAYYYLGLCTHLFEDVGIPLHTKADIADQLLWHDAIEADLDEFWYDEIDYALPGQPVHSIQGTDIKGAIAELATASNADFDALINAYVWGWLDGYDEYYTIARNNAKRTMGYVKGLYKLAEPFT